MQQARGHGAVEIGALQIVGRQQDVAGVRQRGVAGGDGDDGGALVAGNVGHVHQLPRASGVGDDDQAVTGAQHGGAHGLDVGVAGGLAADAEAKELVLCVKCHDA